MRLVKLLAVLVVLGAIAFAVTQLGDKEDGAPAASNTDEPKTSSDAPRVEEKYGFTGRGPLDP